MIGDPGPYGEPNGPLVLVPRTVPYLDARRLAKAARAIHDALAGSSDDLEQEARDAWAAYGLAVADCEDAFEAFRDAYDADPASSDGARDAWYEACVAVSAAADAAHRATIRAQACKLTAGDVPSWRLVDIPVIDGVATLPDGTTIRSEANIVRVPILAEDGA